MPRINAGIELASRKGEESISMCMSTRSIARQIALLGAVAIGAALAGDARATQVRRLNLEELAQRADRVLTARCEGSHRIAGGPAGRGIVEARLVVDRWAKGAAGETLTLRTLAGAAPAGCRPGEELLLFLYPTSSSGFTSPVGLGQGAFKISRDKHGRRVARNAFANEALLHGVAPATRARLGATERDAAADISVDALLDAVEGLAPTIQPAKP
jgi:hypothetical protein